jgi:hypothetical protein
MSSRSTTFDNYSWQKPRNTASKVSRESLILLMSQPIRQAILWPIWLRLLYLETLTPHRIWVL